MRIIALLLVLSVIQLSFSAWVPDTAADSSLDDGEPYDGYQDNDMKAKLQSDPEDDEDDDLENGDGSDVNNQDDDSEPNSETTQPSPSISSQPNNVDENRGMAGPAGRPGEMSPPDYSSVNMRAYIPQCHGGQYQCQKTDPSAQTRCIPQEWRCNGLRDCENNDDESGCSTDQLSRGRSQAKCTQEQYQCHGTGINSVPPLCIERRFVCDGTYQCSYGDDEANCNDRRQQPSTYPNRVPQRPDQPNSGQTNDQSTARADPRDIYRPQPNPNDRKSEEYVQRLEWRDRCFRSCLKY